VLPAILNNASALGRKQKFKLGHRPRKSTWTETKRVFMREILPGMALASLSLEEATKKLDEYVMKSGNAGSGTLL
jgi:hypothetical protein